MKNLLLFSLIIIGLLGCRKDPQRTVCSNCGDNITAESTDYFLGDAQDLAYRIISKDSSHIGFNQIELEENTENCILSKLSAIYEASQSATGNFHDMLDIYHVHQGSRTVLNFLTIKFIDSSSLRTELINNPGNTSEPFLNQLYNDYGFIASTQNWGDNIYFYSPDNYNIRYIKQALIQIPEITQVYLDFYFLDGLSIEHISYPNHDIFIFGYGWGDCPSGCFSTHFWKVKVDDSCIVSLVEEYGNELPE